VGKAISLGPHCRHVSAAAAFADRADMQRTGREALVVVVEGNSVQLASVEVAPKT